jgi:hypothetical protein
MKEQVSESAGQRVSKAGESCAARRKMIRNTMLFAAGAESRNERAGAAYQGEGHGGIFGRIDASALCAERESSGKEEREGESKG